MALTITKSSPQIVLPGKYKDPITGQSFRAYTKKDYKARIADSRARGLGLFSQDSLPKSRSTSLDYFTNQAARMGWGTESLTEATQYELVRLSYDYWLMITLYTNHWICRKIVDTPAEDIIRAWPRLTSDIVPTEVTLIDRAIRRTQTKSKMLMALKWARLFGGAGALIMIDGHEHILDQPLDLDTIELGSYQGIIPFDRWAGIQPSANVSNDITKPTLFNLPEYYDCQLPLGGTFKVHSSRILRFCGPTVPTPEYEARQDWGISVIEVIFEELRKRDNMSWNLLCLSYRANLISMKVPELAQMLSGASMGQQALAAFEQRMQSVNAFLNSNNMMLLPEGGDMSSVSYNPAGWADLYQQFQLDIAGAAGMPVVKLFGRTATGLGQSNDADLQLYYDKIGQEQDTDLRPQLDILYPIICMSELGKVPEDLDLVFPSARVMGEDEKASLAKTMGELIFSAASNGIITRSMALRELKQSSDITGLFTNITDEDINKAEEEEEQGLGGLGEQAGQGPQGSESPEGTGSGAGGVPNISLGKSVKTPKLGGKPVTGEPEVLGNEEVPEEKESSGKREVTKNKTAAERLIEKVASLPIKVTPEDLEAHKKRNSPSIESEEKQPQEVKEKGDEKIKPTETNEVKEDNSGKEETKQKILKNVLRILRKNLDADSGGIKYISFADVPVAVEYQTGDRRIFRNDNNEVVYDIYCSHPYGFITGTTGRDGDEIDVILGPEENPEYVFVIDMIDLGPDVAKREDEDKVMLGFKDSTSAKKAFFDFYPSNFFGGIIKMRIEEFKKAVQRGVL